LHTGAPLLMQCQRLKYWPFVLSLIGLKMANPSQSASGFRFHSLHE
jgi:hypothetical protein